jgi:MGT family glycosyltransferase
MHVALACPDLTGHLNPMTTLGGELARRGYQVTVFGQSPAARFAEKAGIGYVPIGNSDYEAEIAPGRDRLAGLTGLAALKLTGKLLRDIEAIVLKHLPPALRAERVDAIVTDQVTPSGASVAEALGLPAVMACNALALHQEPGVPPPVLGWPYRPGFFGRVRNRAGNRLLHWAAGPMRRTVNEFRAGHRLPPVGQNLTTGFGLAQLAQQPACFDFPRERLPPHFHYTGPWHQSGRDAEVEFPWDRLDGRPLVYASLGTLQNRLGHVFRAIADGCAGLDVQLVLSLGRADAAWDGPTPANAIIVPYAPQLALLDRAAVVVTHAGLNTALESLARGKPMLCLPVTNDQPGVARRVQWLGAGEVLKPGKATGPRVRALVERLLKDGRYRQAAEKGRDQMAGVNGVKLAADIVEQAFRTGQRVMR